MNIGFIKIQKISDHKYSFHIQPKSGQIYSCELSDKLLNNLISEALRAISPKVLPKSPKEKLGGL